MRRKAQGAEGIERAAANAQGTGCKLFADRRFDSYRPMEESQSRKQKLTPDERLEAMRSALRDTIDFYNSLGIPDSMGFGLGAEVLNALCYPFICDLKYGKRDIQKFLLSVGGAEDFQNWHGIFINALIGMKGMDRYELDFRHQDGMAAHVNAGGRGVLRVLGDIGMECGLGMEDGLMIVEGRTGQQSGRMMRGGTLWIKGPAYDSLGEGARGVIIAEGDAHSSAGAHMERGLMVLKKNAKTFLGINMKGGVIIVNGNVGASAGCGMDASFIRIRGDAGENLGEHMKGGYIIVEGNAGRKLGWGMSGGEIHVGGEIESVGKVEKGMIFQKGNLIVGVGR